MFNNRFIPFFWGHHESDKKPALGFMGTIIDETDIGDSAVMIFSSRIHNGGENWAPVTNRPLFEWWNLGEAKMTMLANGNLGIGTTTPEGMLAIQAPAVSEKLLQREVILDAQVSDATEDFFKIQNHTKFNDQFITCLWGHHVSDNRFAMVSIGSINDEQDYGNNAVTIFSSRTWAGELEYGEVINRPLFEWWNHGEAKMTMAADGNLGIGTTEPQRTLHVNDVIRLEPRSTPPDNPMEGDMYMDSSDHILKVFDGTVWRSCWE